MNMEEVRNGERLKMRHWLKKAIDGGEFDGVEWTDKDAGKFRVPWKHASRHGWNIDKDASIFKMWAIYTGKYSCETSHLSEKKKRSLAKLWKANFRCALNALQDIEVVREEGKSRGRDAYKVFRLLPQKKQKSKVTKMRLNSTGCLDFKEEDIKAELKRTTSLPIKNTYPNADDYACLDELIKQESCDDSPLVDHTYSNQMQFFNVTNDSADNQRYEPTYFQQQQILNMTTNYAENPHYGDCQDSDSVESSISSDTEMPDTAQLIELLNPVLFNSAAEENAANENVANEKNERFAVLTQPVNYNPGFFCGYEDFLSTGYNSKSQLLRNDPNLCSGNDNYDCYSLFSYIK